MPSVRACQTRKSRHLQGFARGGPWIAQSEWTWQRLHGAPGGCGWWGWRLFQTLAYRLLPVLFPLPWLFIQSSRYCLSVDQSQPLCFLDCSTQPGQPASLSNDRQAQASGSDGHTAECIVRGIKESRPVLSQWYRCHAGRGLEGVEPIRDKRPLGRTLPPKNLHGGNLRTRQDC